MSICCDRFWNRRGSLATTIITSLVVLVVAIIPPARAQTVAQSSSSLELKGGMINAGTTLSQATVANVISPSPPAKLVGARIKGANVSSARIISGTLTVDSQKLPNQYDADAKAFTRTYSSIGAKTLFGAKIVNAKLSNIKLEDGTDVSGNVEADLSDVTLDNPTVVTAVVSEAGLQTASALAEVANLSYQGDYIKLNVNVPGFRSLNDPTQPAVMAPAGSCFRVTNDIPSDKSTSAQKTPQLSGKFVSSRIRISFSGLMPSFEKFSLSDLLFPPTWTCPASYSGVDENVAYVVDKVSLAETYDRSRFGFTYGIAIVPAKYYRGLGQLGTGATIGPYIGYRVWDRPGSSTSVAVAFGYTNSPSVTQTQSAGSTTNSTTSSQAGYSYAVGVMTNIKGAFSAGVLAGRDIYSSGNTNPYDRRGWIGINLSFGTQ